MIDAAELCQVFGCFLMISVLFRFKLAEFFLDWVSIISYTSATFRSAIIFYIDLNATNNYWWHEYQEDKGCHMTCFWPKSKKIKPLLNDYTEILKIPHIKIKNFTYLHIFRKWSYSFLKKFFLICLYKFLNLNI